MRATAAARAVVLALASACGAAGGAPAGAAGGAAPALPWEPAPWPEPIGASADAADPDWVALGRLLFYDPILSADGETACATCHSELWGMADGLPRAIGAGAGSLSGPGRQGERVGRRNAQTLWNVAYRARLFWDGRVDSLEAQALLPLQTESELDLPPEQAVAALAAQPEYAARFAALLGSGRPLDASALARALAAFQSTLVSRRAPYDAYLAGDHGALSDAMLRGMALFDAQGCGECHVPPLFESDRFADRGVPPVAEVQDAGRFEATGDPAHRGLFRVPTLRNARETAPYFHAGQAADLRAAVEHELAQQRGRDAAALAPAEVDDLVEFISKGLLDLSAEPDRPERVPSGLPVPRDGFRIPR